MLEATIKRFGRQLRKAREARNYTQKQLGQLIGVSANTVALIERGEQGVRWNVMERIFSVLGERPDYYFRDDSIPSHPVARPITPEQALEVLANTIHALPKESQKASEGMTADEAKRRGYTGPEEAEWVWNRIRELERQVADQQEMLQELGWDRDDTETDDEAKKA